MKAEQLKLGAMLLSLAVGMTLGAAAAPTLKVGDPAPKLQTGKWVQGEPVKDFAKGKAYIVEFWATWCPPCREEMPALDRFYREHRAEGLEVVAVSIEESADLAKVREAAKAYSFPSAMLADARVDGFGRIWALPLTFLIDRHGILRKSDWTGGEKIDGASLDRLVLPLLREQ